MFGLVNDPFFLLLANSSNRAVGGFCMAHHFVDKMISHLSDSYHADIMFCFFQMSSLPRRAKVKVQTVVSKDEFSSFSEL